MLHALFTLDVREDRFRHGVQVGRPFTADRGLQAAHDFFSPTHAGQHIHCFGLGFDGEGCGVVLLLLEAIEHAGEMRVLARHVQHRPDGLVPQVEVVDVLGGAQEDRAGLGWGVG